MSSRRSKKRGVGRGRTRLVQLIDLVEIKRTIATRLRQSGRPKNRPAKGDNYQLWQKFNECAESFREQFSAQVLRLALQVEGRRQVQGNLSEVEVSQPRKVTEWKTRYPDAGHLLVVPAPMGASHQPFRDKLDNRVLHTFGVAGLYSLILTKCWYSGLSATFITKVGMWNRNPFTGENFTSSNTGQLELPDGQGNLKTISRGLLGTTNLAWRLKNPLPKKKEKEKA